MARSARGAAPPVTVSRHRFAWLAGLSLLATVTLGVCLRWFLAAEPPPFGQYDLLRHAHSHLGYYGILFPLTWWAWAGRGAPVPGPRTTAVYAVSVLAATIGFARAGYGPLAIAASTVVLGVWLLWAARVAPRALRPRDWLAPAAPSVLLAAIAIPAVAATSLSAPDLAQRLVQAFLTLLLFGVVVPAALALAEAPPPPSALWFFAALGSALALGPAPFLVSFLCLALLGALVAVAGWNTRAPLDVRLLWVGLGVALLALGTRLLPANHSVSIAGLHYAILGPVLLGLARPLLPRVPAPARLAYVALVGAFTLAVLGQAWWLTPRLATVTAWLGTATALAWGTALGVRALLHRRAAT